MNRRQFAVLGAAFGAAALLQPALSAPALAQGAATLPDVPLRLVVPFRPAGPTTCWHACWRRRWARA
ncbi:hypothetical protein ACFQU7_26885 [Pseudoroseomonas wenyumeiae]